VVKEEPNYGELFTDNSTTKKKRSSGTTTTTHDTTTTTTDNTTTTNDNNNNNNNNSSTQEVAAGKQKEEPVLLPLVQYTQEEEDGKIFALRTSTVSHGGRKKKLYLSRKSIYMGTWRMLVVHFMHHLYTSRTSVGVVLIPANGFFSLLCD
jgi:hypothetical protein